MSWLDAPLPAGMNRLVLDGNDVFIDSDTVIFGPVRFGRYTIVRKGAFIAGASPIEIGAFCDIGERFNAATHQQHMPFLPSTYLFADVFDLPWDRGCGLQGLDREKREVDPKPIRIGNDVSIGYGVTVGGGVTVGDGCILRHEAYVNRDCVPYGIYEGVPARLAGRRFPDPVIAQLLGLRWWDWPLDRMQRNRAFFATELNGYGGRIEDLVVP